MRKVHAGGGWPAIRYALRTARRAGGIFRFWKAMRSRNTCKTCALGMGGQKGGMVNEAGRFPEVCKKSMQAMAADMQGAVPAGFLEGCSWQELESLSPRQLESLGRLTLPLYAGPDDAHYRPIGWTEALTMCIGQLQSTPPDRSFFYVSGRSSNEAGFLLQLFARLFGTNNVNNCSFYCHQASGVGLTDALGSGTATVVLEDLDHCDLFVLMGGNPASNHPRLMRVLMDIRRRGGQVVVVNPLLETGLVRFSVPSNLRSLLFGSEIAAMYIQPHIGGDVALLSGVAKQVIESGTLDEAFIRKHTEGWEALQEHLAALSWDDIVANSGVAHADICRLAAMYGNSSNTVFAWTMGLTQHLNGVDNVRAVINLALARGMVGRPAAGLLPLRGHSNVQGVGSVGVTPQLKQLIYDRLESHLKVRLPTTPGLDTLSCLQAMAQDRLDTGFCLGGNLLGASPDTYWTRSCLAKLDMVVYLNTTLNTTHTLGRARRTLILPVVPRDEEAQATTQESMFNYVRLSEGGVARLRGPRSEIELISQIARGVLGSNGPIDWQGMASHHNIRRAIAAVIPGYEPLGSIDHTRQEFHIEGRTFREPRFATANGKAGFRICQLPERKLGSQQLMLMTIRSEGQFNTVVYEEEDLYRGQDRRDVILLNRDDIARLGLQVGQRVTVRSAGGEMKHIVVCDFAIRAGNAAMYYPEANRLVPAQADPASRTPAFKAVPVTLRAELPVLS